MEFHNRATGMVHSVLHGPDGGMVHGAHKTLTEAHNWAKQGLKPMSNSKDIRQADRYIHKTDDGKLLGVATVRNYGVDYTPAARD
jgi:hypothetical protein